MVIAVFSNDSSPLELTFTVLEECLFIDFFADDLFMKPDEGWVD